MQADEIGRSVEKFIRTRLEPFTLSDYLTAASNGGARLSREEGADCLSSCPYVFSFGKEHFLTYAGAFTGRYFSIKPTREEISQGMFVSGGRCIPFADVNIEPHRLVFRYKGRRLKRKVGEFSSGNAVDMFALYGVEFAPQCIAGDNANLSLAIDENDYRLPAKVKLTGYALNLKAGDRLLCYVSNWDKGIIDIERIESATLEIQEVDFKRQEWYEELEDALITCIENTGPGNSIATQLCLVFINNVQELCVDYCGSVMEYLEQNRKVTYADYGVETRLWKAGEEVTAVGIWSEDTDSSYHDMLEQFIYPTDFVVYALVMDQLYKQKRDTQSIVALTMLPHIKFSKSDEAIFAMQIRSIHDKLKKDYNWFADAAIAPLRGRLLEFYKRVRQLALDIYYEDMPLDEYPQQALVVFLQIFTNIMKTLSMMQTDSEYVVEFLDETEKSLESMESDFEKVEGILRDAIEKSKIKDDSGFVVIK